MYHIELRQFPHNLRRFNLDESQLRAIVEPWLHEPWVEIEEQKWATDRAKLKILEGPQIPLSQLTMGRGWPIAEREGTDVTQRVLAAAGGPAPATPDAPPSPPGAPAPAPVQVAQPDAGLAADSLGLELLALLADGAAPLASAWRRAAERYSQRSPSQSLELAEGAVRSLLQARLIALTAPPPADGQDGAGAPQGRRDLQEAQVELVLQAPDSWLEQRPDVAVQMRRA